MTKAKPITPKSQASTPKGNLKGIKNTPIGKNKTPKFKATPTGKVALINGTPKSVGKQNNTPKGKANNSPLVTPKNNKGNSKQNTPNIKQNSPQGKKVIPKGKSPGQKEQLKAAKIVENVDNDDDSDDSDEDINEGVQITEDISYEEADSDAEEESEDDGIKNILGKSLADDSDDDDEDFDDEDEEDEKKGVKRFKGLQPSATEVKKGDEEEEEDSSDDDDDDDSLNDSGPGLKALLKKSLIDDDDEDDEDFSENDEEEDDDEDDISDEEEEEHLTSPVKKQKVPASADDDDDDEEDEDSEDVEDDAETSKLSILTDDLEGDEDEDEDEDDANDSDEGEANVKSKNDSSDNLLTPEELAEREKRSIYVGNLPKDVKKGTLLTLFKQFGTIETLRFRGAVGKDAKTSKKLAVIKRDIHPVVPALHAYIRFADEAAPKKALALNGHQLDGFYLRVDLASGDSQKPDMKKAVFLGNLPFRIDDNSIWDHFADCGKIVSVRIVRDKRTAVGKGFGYVNFDNTDSVALALKLNGTTLQSREIRVKICSDQPPTPKNPKLGGQKRPHPKSNQGGSPKKRKDNAGDKTAVATHNSQNAERRKGAVAGKQQKRSQGEQQRQTGNGKAAGKPGGGGFQGQKADNKKKQKFNKSDQKKKQVAAKLAAKPKKPSTD